MTWRSGGSGWRCRPGFVNSLVCLKDVNIEYFLSCEEVSFKQINAL